MSDNVPRPEDVPWVYDNLEAQLPRDGGKAKQQKKEEEPKDGFKKTDWLMLVIVIVIVATVIASFISVIYRS